MLTEDRLRDYPRILLVSYAVMAMVGWLGGMWSVSRTDFVTFHAASRMVEQGEPALVWNIAAIREAEEALGGKATFAFHYPPTFLLLLTPLAFLSTNLAMVLWSGMGLALCAFAAVRLAPGHLILAAATPAVWVNLYQGQNGMITAGLFAIGMWQLPSKPVSAGACLGLLLFKPHLGVLAMWALFCGREWRALASALVTASGVAALSLGVLGLESWQAFLENIPDAMRFSTPLAFDSGVRMASVKAALIRMGLPNGSAELVQAAMGLLAVALIGAIWSSRKTTSEPRVTVLAAGIVLAAPFLWDYDLGILVVPLAFLARTGPKLRPWQELTCMLCYAAPLLATMAGMLLFPLVPICASALIAVALTRQREAASGAAAAS